MSTQGQSEFTENRARVAAGAPVDDANDDRVPAAISGDRAPMHDEARVLLRDIATGYGYIGAARWSRDAEAVRANLHCALRVLQSIDARMADARPAHPVWLKVESARDRLRARLLEEFSALLDRVVSDLPVSSKESPVGSGVDKESPVGSVVD
jgi:hypothetical protein